MLPSFSLTPPHGAGPALICIQSSRWLIFETHLHIQCRFRLGPRHDGHARVIRSRRWLLKKKKMISNSSKRLFLFDRISLSLSLSLSLHATISRSFVSTLQCSHLVAIVCQTKQKRNERNAKSVVELTSGRPCETELRSGAALSLSLSVFRSSPPTPTPPTPPPPPPVRRS